MLVGGGVVVDNASDCSTKACQMGSAISLANIVGEAHHILVVAVVPPKRDFDCDSDGVSPAALPLI